MKVNTKFVEFAPRTASASPPLTCRFPGATPVTGSVNTIVTWVRLLTVLPGAGVML